MLRCRGRLGVRVDMYEGVLCSRKLDTLFPLCGIYVSTIYHCKCRTHHPELYCCALAMCFWLIFITGTIEWPLTVHSQLATAVVMKRRQGRGGLLLVAVCIQAK